MLDTEIDDRHWEVVAFNANQETNLKSATVETTPQYLSCKHPPSLNGNFKSEVCNACLWGQKDYIEHLFACEKINSIIMAASENRKYLSAQAVT